MTSYWPVGLALCAVIISYLVMHVIRKRDVLRGLPQPPMGYKLFGHLPIAAECTKLFPPRVHVQLWIRYIQKRYNMGEIFYLDWWPLGPRWLFIADPEVASEYITSTQCLPKSRMMTDYINLFLGSNNMVSLEGAAWKHLRAMFNPGFASAHLMTLVPYILEATLVFCEILREKAKSGELIEMEQHATRLTIDIIGKVALDADFDSQRAAHPIAERFRERPLLMPYGTGLVTLSRFELIRRYKLWQNGRAIDRLIGEELDRKVAARHASASQPHKSMKERKRSIVDLAIDSYYKDQPDTTHVSHPSNAPLPADFRRDVVDSLKTFIFAGHDTTASTIAYAIYLLHFHPERRERLVKEVRSIFGHDASSPEAMAAKIKTDPHIVNRLEYVAAVVKETLRLFPPASTMRYIEAGTGLYLTDPKTGDKLPLSGFEVWAPPTLIGRNERFFPQPVNFIPERFVPSMTPFPDAELFTLAGRDAWRPFEKGPRSCIGQELAMIEMKIALALVVSHFDFAAEYDGRKVEHWDTVETCDEFADGVPGSKRMTVEGNPCYQILKGAAKPRDGMPGRVLVRNA